MSMKACPIEGYGINTNGISDRIVPEKFVAFAKEQNIYREGHDDPEDYIYDVFYGYGDLLCHCDDSNQMNYGSTEYCDYFLFAPAYPWYQNEEYFKIKSKRDVETIIVNAVQKLTDMTEEEIRHKIDYIQDIDYYC